MPKPARRNCYSDRNDLLRSLALAFMMKVMMVVLVVVIMILATVPHVAHLGALMVARGVHAAALVASLHLTHRIALLRKLAERTSACMMAFVIAWFA